MSKTKLEGLHKAVMAHDLQAVAKSISDGDGIETLDREGRTPLFYAVRDGDLEIINKLIDCGSEVNVQDKNGETPLHFAVRGYQPSAVTILIEHGAQVDVQDIHGNTPLWRAVFESRGRGELIEIFINSGSDARIKNNHGVSPNDLAVTISNYDVMKFLHR